MWAVIRNFAVVGPEQATRERLGAALAAAPDLAVYRIGRGADPLPVAAGFDPVDQPGCRSLLDWFERGAPSGAVLLVDDWGLCAEQDPELGHVVQWIAAFGPSRGVQTVVTARRWDELPVLLRRHMHGEPTDFLALQGISDLDEKWQRRDFRTAVGVDALGWPVHLDISVDGHGLGGTYLGPVEQRGQRVRSALLGLMLTHSSKDLNVAYFDMKNTGMFADLDKGPHTTFMLTGQDDDEWFDRYMAGLQGELSRRQHAVDPSPDLLICVDSAEVLIERQPWYQNVLEQLTRAGRTLGIRMLYSGDTFPAQLPFQLPEWPSATPPHDFAQMTEMLPHALLGPGGRVPLEIALPPLHKSGFDLRLEGLPPGAIGLLDKPFEQRRDLLTPAFGELRHGAIVGKAGTGKSTTLRTLATVLGDDIGRYQLLDGPGEPLDQQRHIVVTARSWDQVPQFIRDSLAFGIEFRLDDPATSLVDAREAARVPDRPGFGLSVPDRLHTRIALP